MSPNKPKKPIDCFTEEQKKWAVEKIKAELPDAWERLVRRQAHNMELYTPSDDEKSEWLRDQVLESRIIATLPLDYGDDGWEGNRQDTIVKALVAAALNEARELYFGKGNSDV